MKDLQLNNENIEYDLGLLGIPYDSGAGSIKGTSFGPDTLRSIFYKLPLITRDGMDISNVKIKDFQNVKVFSDSGEKTRQEIVKTVSKIINKSNKPLLTIGGDHSVTYSIVEAFSKKKEIGLVWFDAHPDSLDEYINSKYSHGCPLRRIIENNHIKPENVLVVGTRYYEGDEYEFIKNNSIFEIPMYRIDKENYKETFSKAIEGMIQRTESLYVSIDIDVVDPAYAPGTGSLVPVGLHPYILLQLIQMLPDEICGYDIVEYCPDLDVNMMTGKLILFIMSEIMKKCGIRVI